MANGNNEEARKKVNQIVDLARPLFEDPKYKLATKISLDVKEIKMTNDDFRLRTLEGCKETCVHGPVPENHRCFKDDSCVL